MSSQHTKAQQYLKDMAVKQNTYDIVSLKFDESERPDFKPTIGLPYIKFGKDNNYPSFLARLYQESSKHQSIINGKCTYIYGKGLYTNEENEQAKAFIKANKKLIQKCIFDVRNYGGCYIYAVPNKINTAYHFSHIPFSSIRTNEGNTEYYYSNEFGKKRVNDEAMLIPSFVYGVKQASIIAYREYNGANESPYPLPDWFAALNWIESDIEVSKHTLTNAKTGFSASKFINFYNGKPTTEQKRDITKQFKAEHGGSAGEKIVIAFNDNDAKAPTIDDLGTSDLTKEDFQNVNDLISENIYAGHGITTPQLFGVPQKEGLGGDGQKLKTGYTIFNNTYVNAKQQEMEDLIEMLAKLNGINEEIKFKQLDPIGIEFDTATITANLSRNEIRELLGYEADDVQPAEVIAPVKAAVEDAPSVNNTLTNLTGRQRQNVMGIVRQFGNGKLTKLQASILLKNGYGLTEQDINDFLGIDDNPLTDDAVVKQAFSESEDDLILAFAQFGENAKDYTKVLSKSAMIETKQMFAEVDSKIENYIKLNPLASPSQVATTLNVPLADVNTTISKGNITEIKQALPKFEVRYSYEKREDVSGADLLPTSRPFCVKMIGLDRMYSREDIQKISSVLGYDVFNRAGGFWNNNGKIEVHCRHEFKSHVVIKKK